MTGAAEPWWRQPVRFFQHLLREPDAAGLDPARLIQEAAELGAGAYIAMGGGFSAWYPTALASQRVNPHLEGDFLGRLTEAAQAAGIRTIARVDISKGRPEWVEAHRDWFTAGPDGRPTLVWEMPQTCATGPIWQAENFAIVAELLDRYPVDGFFYNYLHVPRCWCDRCRALVRDETGADVPPPGRRSPPYERWRQSYLADYVGRLRGFIRARRPDAALIPYHHVRDGWRYRAMAAVSDLIGAQVSNPLVVNPIDPQPQWTHWAAEEALMARAVKPESAPLLIQTGSEFFASRQTAMPAGRIVRNLAQAAAHGANTAPAVNGLLRQDDPRAVPALLAFGRYQVAQADWYRDLETVARIALVRSQDSIDWGPDGGRPGGDPLRPGHVAEFRGLYEILAALRHPCDVLPDGFAAGDLGRYAAVLLPAVSCLGTADAAALDAYVAAGGCVIATADPGACDCDGASRSAPLLGCLPQLPGPARSVFGAYFELAEPALRAAFGEIPHIGADGDFWAPLGPAADADGADLRLIGPFRNNAPEFAVVRGPGAEPGLLRFRFGRGRALWLPWRVGALYHRQAIPEYATLVGHLLGGIAGDPPIRSDAPDAVEFILYRHPRGLVLHLLNGAATQTKPLVHLAPLAGFAVRVRTPATRATRLDTGTALAVERDGADAVFFIDRLDSFATVALT